MTFKFRIGDIGEISYYDIGILFAQIDQSEIFLFLLPDDLQAQRLFVKGNTPFQVQNVKVEVIEFNHRLSLRNFALNATR